MFHLRTNSSHVARVARSKKLKMPNLAISSFQKVKSSIMKKGQLKIQKFVKITRFKDRISLHISNFAQISPKLVLNTLFSSTFKKGRQIDKSFFSGKPFQKGQIWMIWLFKRPNGNHVPRFAFKPIKLQFMYLC